MQMMRLQRKNMALDVTIFEIISPSRFITFTIPSPDRSPSLRLFRVAVLDSPVSPAESPPRVAAMFVPKTRESDWIFCTESGHLQLLLSLPEISRLILIGDQPLDSSDSPTIYHRSIEDHDRQRLERSLKPLVKALSPKNYHDYGNSDIPILNYEDNVVSSVQLEKSVGCFVGEMIVEDVQIETDSGAEFRRRIRFKRMPNLVQTDIRTVPIINSDSDSKELGKLEFSTDLTVLVHPYLAPMVASLALIGPHFDEHTRIRSMPKALCIGVGGGALLSFLKLVLGFKVVGVEIDIEVLRIARQYFGLDEDSKFMRVHVGDGIQFLQKLSQQSCAKNGKSIEAKFDVIMVDLDSNDARNGISAPPLEFARKNVLLAVKTVLVRSGIFVINVIPPNRKYYDGLIAEFQQVFSELYEIDVMNGENFVLIATVVPVIISDQDRCNGFVQKLRSVVPVMYIDSIKRI